MDKKLDIKSIKEANKFYSGFESSMWDLFNEDLLDLQLYSLAKSFWEKTALPAHLLSNEEVAQIIFGSELHDATENRIHRTPPEDLEFVINKISSIVNMAAFEKMWGKCMV